MMRLIAIVIAGMGMALVGAGCEAPPKGQVPSDVRILNTDSRPTVKPREVEPTRVPARDDIIEIIQYWPRDPWGLRDGRVRAFRVATYFVSGKTEKGAFVDGVIRAHLYRLYADDKGDPQRELAHEWELPASEAMGFAVRKAAIGGYYYGFILSWPDDLNLGGDWVQIVFSYQRNDGREIESPPKLLRVPMDNATLPTNLPRRGG
ncbi:MAG: hypothetical protein KDA32_00125 [Phycisphaerales bacterium]|nr:hypothetical protein [Phycisphaerales bacterium]